MPQEEHPFIGAVRGWTDVLQDPRVRKYDVHKRFALKNFYWKNVIMKHPQISADFKANPEEAVVAQQSFFASDYVKSREMQEPKQEEPGFFGTPIISPPEGGFTGESVAKAYSLAKFALSPLHAKARQMEEGIEAPSEDTRIVRSLAKTGGELTSALTTPEVIGVMGGGLAGSAVFPPAAPFLMGGAGGYFAGKHGAPALVEATGGELEKFPGMVADLIPAAASGLGFDIESPLTPEQAEQTQLAAMLFMGIYGGVKHGAALSKKAPLWTRIKTAVKRIKTTENLQKLTRRMEAQLGRKVTAKDLVDAIQEPEAAAPTTPRQRLADLKKTPMKDLPGNLQLERLTLELKYGKFKPKTVKGKRKRIAKLKRDQTAEAAQTPAEVGRARAEAEKAPVPIETAEAAAIGVETRLARQADAFELLETGLVEASRLERRIHPSGVKGARVPTAELEARLKATDAALEKGITEAVNVAGSETIDAIVAQMNERAQVFAAEARNVRELLPLSQKRAVLEKVIGEIKKSLPKRKKGAPSTPLDAELLRIEKLLGNETRLIEVEKLGRKPMTMEEINTHEAAFKEVVHQLTDPIERGKLLKTEVETASMEGGKIVKRTSTISGVPGPEFNKLTGLLQEYLTAREALKTPGMRGMPDAVTLPKLNTALARRVFGNKAMRRNMRPVDYEGLASIYESTANRYERLGNLATENRRAVALEEPRTLKAVEADTPRGKVPQQIKDVDLDAQVEALIAATETKKGIRVELLEEKAPTGKAQPGSGAAFASAEETAREFKSHIHVSKAGQTRYTGVKPDFSEQLPTGPEGTVTFARKPGTLEYKIVGGGEPNPRQLAAFKKLAKEQLKGETPKAPIGLPKPRAPKPTSPEIIKVLEEGVERSKGRVKLTELQKQAKELELSPAEYADFIEELSDAAGRKATEGLRIVQEGEAGFVLGRAPEHKHLPNLENPQVAFTKARERALNPQLLEASDISPEAAWLAPDRSYAIPSVRGTTHSELLAKITGKDVIINKVAPGISQTRASVLYRENLEVSAMRSGYIRKADVGIYTLDSFKRAKGLSAIVDDIIPDAASLPEATRGSIKIRVEALKSFKKPTKAHPFMDWDHVDFTFSELEVYGFDLNKLIDRELMRRRQAGYLKVMRPEWVDKLSAGIRQLRTLPGEMAPDVAANLMRKTIKSEHLKSVGDFMEANLEFVGDFVELPEISAFLEDPVNLRAYKAVAEALRNPDFLDVKNADAFIQNLQNIGTNLDQFSKILELTMSEWGRIGVRWRQAVEAFKDMGVDVKKRPKEMSWYERGIEAIRQADDVRRAALISQFVTAFRNATVQGPVVATRVTTEALAGVIDTATRRILYGETFEALDPKGRVVNSFLTKEHVAKLKARHPEWEFQPVKESPWMAFAHSLSLMESLVKQTKRTLLRPLKNANPETQLMFFDPEIAKVLEKFPDQVRHMFSFVDPDIPGMGAYGKTVGRVVRGLTWFNRWQEFLFRRTFAEGIVRAELQRHGIKLSAIDEVPVSKLRDIVVPAVEDALTLTFAGGPKTTAGKLFLQTWDKFRPLTTAVHPFARFAINSSKYVGRHSPFGIMMPNYAIKANNLLKSGKPTDIMVASRMVAQATVGTGFIYTGYLLAKSEWAGPKWYAFYDPETKKQVADIRPYMPFGLYLYFGHMLVRAQKRATQLQEARRQVGEPEGGVQYGIDQIASLAGEFFSRDSLEALVSVNRLAGSGLIFAELLLNGDRILPRDPIDRNREMNNLFKEFAGSYFGGYTTPARMIKDVYALWNLEDQEYQSSRTKPFIGNLVRNFPTDWQEYLGHKLPKSPSPTGSMRMNSETGEMEPSGYAAVPEKLGPLPGATGRQLTSYISKPRDIVRYEIDRLVQDRIAEYRNYFPTKTGNRVIDEIKIKHFGEWMVVWGREIADNPLFAELPGEERHELMRSITRRGRQWANIQTWMEANKIAKVKGLPAIPYPQILGREEARELRKLGIGTPKLETEDLLEEEQP